MIYDSAYGDARVCRCGLTYVQHFDQDKNPVSCYGLGFGTFTQAVCSCGQEAVHTYHGPLYCGQCASAQFF